MEAGRQGGVAPGAAAVVLARGAVVHASVHGLAQRVPEPRALGPADLFDLASLTKVVATASLAALLAEEGTLPLDAPAARWLPGLAAGGGAAITVRHLLAHASGMAAWRPLSARTRGRDAILAAVLAEPLEAAPGSRAVYSDLGFVALGAVVEAAAGAPLDVLFDARVAGPLALADTFFLPARDPALAARRRAAHGFAAARRVVDDAGHGVLCGEVDDDNARAMGGVAGHAGLFGSARDVARLGQAWLDAVHGRSPWLGADTAARFVARDAATPGSERALGWDTPSREGSSLGARLGRGPRGAVGHLGFTGTSLWVDLDHEVVCALLTNHVHPDGADRARMRAFRATFHDAVAEALGI
ncbi:MAG: serine hydrolase domain-containing protein [Anaeromyxobacteraceae bacterium]